MATINFNGNTYSGEVLEDLLVYAAKGNDTFQEGLIHIKPGVQKRYVLPGMQLGSIIQANNATPTSTQGGPGEKGFNSYTLFERYLDPKDFMVYLEFNPRDFEDYWRFAQPTGELNFRELDPKVQATMLRLLIDKKDQYINDSIWCGCHDVDGKKAKFTAPTGATVLGGESAAGPMSFFDGFLVRVLDNVNTTNDNEKASGQVKIAGANTFFKIGTDGQPTSEIDGAKVEQALYAMWKECPKHIRKSDKLKYVMGWELWDAYEEYLTTKKDFKYTDNTTSNVRRFKGKDIVVINGVPEHTIALGRFDKSMESNLWMGVDYATDQESVKVERLQANSELYFFQMRMKMDVNIVLPGELVVHTAYTKNA